MAPVQTGSFSKKWCAMVLRAKHQGVVSLKNSRPVPGIRVAVLVPLTVVSVPLQVLHGVADRLPLVCKI